MSNTKIVLDRQATARVFSFGTTSSGEEGLVTINKGTSSASTVVLDVKGSQNIAGDLNLTGNLNITGSINESSVNNLSVTDLTIRVNKGGTTGGAAGAGIQVEGTSGAVIAAITYASGSATKFQIGDGTSQHDVVDIDSVQTLTNKIIAGGQISGNINGNSGNVTGTVAVGNGGTGLTSLTSGAVVLGNGSSNPTFVAPGANGDVLKVVGGVWTSGTPTSPTYMRRTTISGTQDGVNKTFTLGSSVTASTELVTVNGQVLTSGSSNDYLISGTTLTFQAAFNAPTATDVIQVWGVY